MKELKLGSHPRLLYLPGFSPNLPHELQSPYKLSSVNYHLGKKQQASCIAADALIDSVTMCRELSSWSGRRDNYCAHVEPLPLSKC